jgi:tetratricopeptide (TPR) repeat protein
MANARDGGRVVVLVALLVWPSASTAQTAVAAGRIVSVQGRAEVERGGATRLAIPREPLHIGDVVRTGPATRVAILLVDETRVKLNENSTLRIKAVAPRPAGGFLPATRRAAQTLLELLGGEGWVGRPGQREGLTIETPVATATIRGTEFNLAVTVDESQLTLIEGQIDYRTPQGGVLLSSGEVGVARSGQSPQKQLLLHPKDAVQWTLYYPPVLYLSADEFPAGIDWQGSVRRSFDAYLRGDTSGAFDAITGVPATVSDPRFFAYRAHLLLTVGRVNEASADIERALRLAPNDPNPLALQAIIAVAQGDKERALATAERAVQAAPTSATAHIALSYAQQARFDLDGARDSVENAVALDSNNALAWARLSELWASFGELDRALRAAQRAAVLDPNLSRTQTVLGYAYLMRVQTARAREAFEKAIALDQADPLPRLGLGLAKIRDGKLHDGGREIAVAASLDPSNAIVRAYLGKTYYEEKRTGLDQREYAVAKQLDPNDPTPYFYDAIAEQTTNRPVQALQDMQRAIELNDNRAVYRSRFLLDADAAARSAAQARIYTDLGFQQLALVEGWKSVSTDPTNFSAHRLLADTYSTLPRHDIARVSELLQSQLLQPLNRVPIQPLLAETNLALISAGGPGALSFNEFNPIFNRDGVTALATGLGGENGTWAGEGVVAGLYKKLAFSAGYTHFATNGWRPNADQTEHIANVFAQLEITPQTSIQGEYRYRHSERGDLLLNFFKDDFRRNDRLDVETKTYRGGVRHAFTPDSILLLSYMYQRSDANEKDRPEIFPFNPLNSIEDSIPRQRSNSVEAQHLFRSTYVNTVAGAGYVDVNAKATFNVVFNPLFGLPPFDTSDDLDVQHTNLYLYAYIKPLRQLTLTLGASGDFFETDCSCSDSRNQFNPKFGVVWNPLPNTTVRAAAFRVLKRTLITDQTLEPTQVAGFNQFFDDFNATSAWRYGVALDQKFGDALFGGIELSRRDLSVPIQTVDTGTGELIIKRGDQIEYLTRAYLLWTPHPWLALSAEYQFEQFKRDDLLAVIFFKEVTTHRVPLGLRFFHPSGFSASVRGTYYNQDGDFIRGGGFTFEPGHSDFFLVDLALSYRLPQRYGFITVGATNLFDRHFQYQETDFGGLSSKPRIGASLQPARLFFTRITLSF